MDLARTASSSPRVNSVPIRLPSRPSRAISTASSIKGSKTSGSYSVTWQRMLSNTATLPTSAIDKSGIAISDHCLNDHCLNELADSQDQLKKFHFEKHQPVMRLPPALWFPLSSSVEEPDQNSFDDNVKHGNKEEIKNRGKQHAANDRSSDRVPAQFARAGRKIKRQHAKDECK